MPVVPIRKPSAAQPAPMPQPDPTFLAMAAAQMHGEGKLEPSPELKRAIDDKARK